VVVAIVGVLGVLIAGGTHVLQIVDACKKLLAQLSRNESNEVLVAENGLVVKLSSNSYFVIPGCRHGARHSVRFIVTNATGHVFAVKAVHLKDWEDGSLLRGYEISPAVLGHAVPSGATIDVTLEKATDRVPSENWLWGVRHDLRGRNRFGRVPKLLVETDRSRVELELSLLFVEAPLPEFDLRSPQERRQMRTTSMAPCPVGE
jgi:hypothetical protein